MHLAMLSLSLALGTATAGMAAEPQRQAVESLALPKEQSAWTAADKEAQRKAGAEVISQLNAAIKEGKPNFRIPSGDYRFADNGKWALTNVYKVENMEIDATGATFWYEAWKVGLFISEAKNVTLKGLSIDFDPLPYTQGRVLDVHEGAAPGESWIDFSVDPGFLLPDAIEKDPLLKRAPSAIPLVVFDAKGENIIYNQWGKPSKIERLPSGAWRVFSEPPSFPWPNSKVFSKYSDYGMKKGDRIVMMHRLSDPAVLVHKAENVVLKDVTLFSSPSLAFVDSGHWAWKGGNAFDGCKIMRRPGTERLLSATADGFNSAMAAKGPRIVNCEASYNGDDFVNIHGEASVVIAAPDDKTLYLCMRCDFEGDFIFRPQLGLKIFARDSGEPRGEAKIVSFKKERKKEILELSKKSAELLGTLGIDSNAIYKIELDAPVKAGFLDYVIYDGAVGEGFEIKGNKFSHSLAGGIILQSRNGVVEGNFVEAPMGEGMRIMLYFDWLEGALCENITVKDNVFKDCLASTRPGLTGKMIDAGLAKKQKLAVVCVKSQARRSAPFPMLAVHHSNISFVDNKIEGCKWNGFFIDNAKDIAIKGNRIERSAFFDPKTELELNLGEDGGIALGGAADKSSIEIKGNSFGFAVQKPEKE